MMAGLPPVAGLYVSFFSVIAYILLGTSKHLSLGEFKSCLFVSKLSH